MENEILLKEALQSLDIPFQASIMRKFALYYRLLLEWNQRMNLISKKDESRIYSRHFLESLGLVLAIDFPKYSRIMDLGSGAGLPGIPMKIVRPDLKMVLVESVRKKINFLQMVHTALNMDNLDIFHGRAETMTGHVPFDFVVSRSVSNLINLCKWSRDCLKPGGQIIAVKGSGVNDELARLSKSSKGLQIQSWQRIGYDPFPEIKSLENRQLIIINI